jgi:hypothetical protein
MKNRTNLSHAPDHFGCGAIFQENVPSNYKRSLRKLLTRDAKRPHFLVARVPVVQASSMFL